MKIYRRVIRNLASAMIPWIHHDTWTTVRGLQLSTAECNLFIDLSSGQHGPM